VRPGDLCGLSRARDAKDGRGAAGAPLDDCRTAWRRAIELSLGDSDTAKLRSIAQSRTEPASRVERARILLAYREDPSFFAVGRALGLHHQTVQRCVERAVAEGPMAALDDRPRPGREPTITGEAKAWLVSLACQKAKDLGERVAAGVAEHVRVRLRFEGGAGGSTLYGFASRQAGW
jgi:transposase